MPTPRPTSTITGGVKSATEARWEASTISPSAPPTANSAVTTGRAAATSDPKRKTRITSAPRTPAPSAAPPPPSSAARTASPPSSTRSPSPSASFAVSTIRRVASTGTFSASASSVTVA